MHTEACCLMQELVATKLPRVHAKMTALHCDMTIIATDWFICLFATALPSEVRLADLMSASELQLKLPRLQGSSAT